MSYGTGACRKNAFGPLWREEDPSEVDRKGHVSG